MAKPKQTFITKLTAKQYSILILSALTIFALTASIAARYNLGNFEIKVLDVLYDMPQAPTVIFLAITQLGSAWFLLTLVLVFFVNRSRQVAFRLLLTGFITYAMIELSKTLVGRPRPEFLLPHILPREQFVTGQGFPSGHTALITVIGLILLPYLPKIWRPAVPIAIILVGLSRIYLGVHAPLDVIGGFCVGVIVALAYYLGASLGRPFARQRAGLAKKLKRS